MTPDMLAGLAVAKDALRESGFDEATLARMERHVDPQHERDLCIRTAVRVRAAATAIVDALWEEAGISVSMQALGWLGTARTQIDLLDCTPHVPPFS